MIEPKQKPAGKPVHTAEKARLPRIAMRAVWLRTREGTRRFAAEEKQEGQYREAASLEERALDTAVSAAEIPSIPQSTARPCPLEAVGLLSSILSGPEADTDSAYLAVIRAVSSAFWP